MTIIHRFSVASLLFFLVLFLAACGNKPESKNNDENSSTQSQNLPPGMMTIPTIEQPVMPTPSENVLSFFPIQQTSGDDFTQGKYLYEANCARCHGLNGEGQLPDPLGPNMAPPHNDDGHTWHHPDQANFETVWYGRNIAGEMPAFYDKLSLEDIMLILGYIKTWWNEENLNTQLDQTRSAADLSEGNMP